MNRRPKVSKEIVVCRELEDLTTTEILLQTEEADMLIARLLNYVQHLGMASSWRLEERRVWADSDIGKFEERWDGCWEESVLKVKVTSLKQNWYHDGW